MKEDDLKFQIRIDVHWLLSGSPLTLTPPDADAEITGFMETNVRDTVKESGEGGVEIRIMGCNIAEAFGAPVGARAAAKMALMHFANALGDLDEDPSRFVSELFDPNGEKFQPN